MRKATRSGQAKQITFLVAAGFMTKGIFYDLYFDLGDQHFFIDVGSSLDPFAGVPSRPDVYPALIKDFCKIYPEYMAEGACQDLQVQEGKRSITAAKRAI